MEAEGARKSPVFEAKYQQALSLRKEAVGADEEVTITNLWGDDMRNLLKKDYGIGDVPIFEPEGIKAVGTYYKRFFATNEPDIFLEVGVKVLDGGQEHEETVKLEKFGANRLKQLKESFNEAE